MEDGDRKAAKRAAAADFDSMTINPELLDRPHRTFDRGVAQSSAARRIFARRHGARSGCRHLLP